jgi:predicted nucleic acid-binding protein
MRRAAVPEPVFVDTGAWIALALTRDPLHGRALEAWSQLRQAGARLCTSVPVVVETFTFLDRNVSRATARAWKDSLAGLGHFAILPALPKDLDRAWSYFDRADLHKLSATDALSFVLMQDRRIRRAFAFDTHFAAAGFRLIG